MALTLRIENEAKLADGGPTEFRFEGRRTADIGRDAHLDWTLPDPTREISGKHCEVTLREGAYWLTDLSRNGTYLNGSNLRMQSPYRLRHGDRLSIGRYIVVVEIDGVEAEPAGAAPAEPAADFNNWWKPVGDAASPPEPMDLRSRSEKRPVHPDFMDWVVDIPTPQDPRFVPRPAPAPAPPPAGPAPAPPAYDWTAPDVPAPAPPPPPAAPTPRRPIWRNLPPSAPWAAEGAPATPEPSGFGEPRPSAPPVPPAPPAFTSPVPPAPAPQAPPAYSTPVPPPPAFAAEPAGFGGEAEEVLRRFARGAGLPDEAVAGLRPGDLAERLGRMVSTTIDNLRQLLQARSQTKRAARIGGATMIQAIDNNPLKFSPSSLEAMKILFGPASRSYLDADAALKQSFEDLKAHQVRTFIAMQHALQMLIEDLDPKSIEEALGGKSRPLDVLSPRKTRAWELYVERWRAKTERREDGILGLFMDYFAQCYEKDADKWPG